MWYYDHLRVCDMLSFGPYALLIVARKEFPLLLCWTPAGGDLLGVRADGIDDVVIHPDDATCFDRAGQRIVVHDRVGLGDDIGEVLHTFQQQVFVSLAAGAGWFPAQSVQVQSGPDVEAAPRPMRTRRALEAREASAAVEPEWPGVEWAPW
jgi:hypothetical protein